MHTTQLNWNQTIYFGLEQPLEPRPLTYHFLLGRITEVTGVTFESGGELPGWGSSEGCSWLGVC